MSDDKIIPFRRPDRGASNGASSNGASSGGPPLRVRITRSPEPEPEPERKPTLGERIKASPLTFLIAAINVAFFVWIERHGSSQDAEVLVRFGAVQTELVRGGDYWRIASYMVVHIGWGHLLMNTWAGASWCIPVERILGRTRFVLLYLLAGLGGGAAVVVFSDAITAGASGAMFGIIGALLTIRYRQLPTWRMFVNDRGVRSTVAQIALWTVLGVVALPMSQAGHFGGLVTGALFTWVLTLPRDKRMLGYAGYAAAFLAFVLFAIRPWAPTRLDWSTVKVNRMGSVADPARVAVQAGPACRRGVERACVVRAIMELDPKDKATRDAARRVFDPACAHGDKDACAGLGILVSGEDLVRGTRLLNEACTAGSEWGCEFAMSGLTDEDLEIFRESDAAAD